MVNSKTTKIRKLSWEEIENSIGDYIDIISKENFDYIVTVARGGLIPAVLLSHKLGIRDFLVIRIVRTVSDELHAMKDTPIVEYNENDLKKIEGKKVLIVEDIVGSGITLQETLKLIGAFKPSLVKTFSLAFSITNYSEGMPKPDYIGSEYTEWIVFPWESQAR